MNGPIDYDSPLGISKREWAKVLGANLALLLIAYAVALIFTMSGSDAFLLNFHSDDLQRIEETLWSWNVYPIIQIAFSCVETWIMCSYSSKRLVKWYWIIPYFALRIVVNVLFTLAMGSIPSVVPFVLGVAFVCTHSFIYCKNEKWWKVLLRIIIAFAVSFALNGAIVAFRTKIVNLWQIGIENSAFFALSVEYDLALLLALGCLTLLVKWEKGDKELCLENPAASGSSPTSTRCSRKNSAKKNSINISPKARKRLMLLKAKVIAIQTVALVVIAALPWFSGRPVEFTLLYLAFCMTRLVLGFSHSLHFKSELSCVTIGALVFWGLTYLAPSAEASIIISLAYGAGLALGFRLYWELHDLIMYRKAAKTDRYAMLYTALKGNTDQMHIRGVMRLRGHQEADEIKMVQMYMAKEKVDYIAQWLNMPLRSVDRRLTELAEELYARR